MSNAISLRFGLGLLALASCGGAVGESARPKDFTGTGALGGAAPVCGGAPKYAKPLVVDLDGDSRLHLETAMKKGVVFVAYDCSTLRVLPTCRFADGGYEYAGASTRELVVQMKSRDDLATNLPLSAGKLGAEVSSGRSIDLALVSVGLRSTTLENVAKGELTGNCEGATHFVQTASVGAFSMATGSVGKARAVAEMFAIGASGASESSRNSATTDGSLESCRKADSESTTPPKACQAPLSVQLLPIAAAKNSVVDPSGKNERKAKPKRSPCREGYVFANEICTNDMAVPHLCNPKDVSDCKTQCQSGNYDSCYNYGVLAPPSETKPYLQKACEKGVPDACGQVAVLGFDMQKEGDAPDNAQAIALAKQGCRAGGAHACSYLGDMLVGLFTMMMEKKPDARGGVRAYERGCALGAVEACHALGELTMQGEHVTKDIKRGVELLDRACVGDESASCLALAKVLLDPQLRDPDRAARAASKVCDGLKGDPCNDAIKLGVEAGHATEAFKWSEAACSRWPANCDHLGDMFRDGIGTVKDRNKALESWSRACADGSSPGACKKAGKRAR